MNELFGLPAFQILYLNWPWEEWYLLIQTLKRLWQMEGRWSSSRWLLSGAALGLLFTLTSETKCRDNRIPISSWCSPAGRGSTLPPTIAVVMTTTFIAWYSVVTSAIRQKKVLESHTHRSICLRLLVKVFQSSHYRHYKPFVSRTHYFDNAGAELLLFDILPSSFSRLRNNSIPTIITKQYYCQDADVQRSQEISQVSTPLLHHTQRPLVSSIGISAASVAWQTW